MVARSGATVRSPRTRPPKPPKPTGPTRTRPRQSATSRPKSEIRWPSGGDALIEPIVKGLARRLKRTLQDNQNELLDALRSKNFHWSTDLLPEPTEHIDSYATAALPSLEQAAEAGVSFAGTGSSGVPGVDALLGIGHDLAEAVVGPLRRRLTDDEGLVDAEESVVADHVGSAFREWKGERIERLAGDHVVAAFSAGSIVGGRRQADGPARVGGGVRRRRCRRAPIARTTD